MSEKDSKDCLLVTQGLDLSCTHYGCHCGCHLRFPNLSVTSCNIPNCGQLHYSGGAISPRELQVVVSIWGCPTSWESHGLCSGNSAGNGQLHHTPHVNPDNFLPPGCSQDGTPISKIQSNQVYFDFQALIVDDCRMMGPTPKKQILWFSTLISGADSQGVSALQRTHGQDLFRGLSRDHLFHI